MNARQAYRAWSNRGGVNIAHNDGTVAVHPGSIIHNPYMNLTDGQLDRILAGEEETRRHVQNVGSIASQQSRSPITCGICGKTGHNRKTHR